MRSRRQFQGVAWSHLRAGHPPSQRTEVRASAQRPRPAHPQAVQQDGERRCNRFSKRLGRKKDPELLRAVEHLSRNETATGIQLLQQQARITEIPDPRQRIEAIAKDYVARPENTLVVSPDNASRRDINDAIRAELQGSGVLSK